MTALVAFYSSPTSQKLIQELPTITAEAMQAVMPLMRQKIDAMTQRLQQEAVQMAKDSKAKSGQNSQAAPN